MYNLMIVEAPPKARKIQQILNTAGLNFKVIATLGYIVDLPQQRYGLNFDNNKIDIEWEFTEGKKKLMQEIKELAKNASEIYISTDDDREGERIAKDVIEKLKIKDYKRVVFTSISKNKILEAINNPRDLDLSYTKSAVTRRVIDRDIGYPVSDILRYDLRKKGYVIPNNLGSGRIISPTLHILNENQKAIDSFVEEDYKRIKVRYLKDGVAFHGLFDVRFMVDSNDNMMQLQLIREQMIQNSHTVMRYTPKNREASPPPPLTTVTLQQSCSNLYKFKGKYTMKLAQLLYYLGYITYHRTDSVIQSEETYLEIINYLSKHYNPDDILITKRKIKNRETNIQEGHEAIRPVYIDDMHSPENFKEYLKTKDLYYERNELSEKDKKNKYKFNQDHLRVYEIIWYRAIAFQMQNAIYDASEVVVDIAGNTIKMVANKLKTIKLYEGGEKVLSGWLTIKTTILESSIKDGDAAYSRDPVYLPEFIEGESLNVVEITTIEGTTERPHYFGEGRLIKKIDSSGIARPSTLASILPSLEEKKCIIYDNNLIKITPLGRVVDDWITEHAFWLVDLEMAHQFEQYLDKIAKNEDDINDIDLIMDYHHRIELLKESIGFMDDEDEEPYEWQIDKAHEIAEKNGIELGEEIFKSKAKIEVFLNNNMPKKEYESLGTCPSCKKGKIRELEKGFGCSEYRNGCKFTVWKKSMFNFFERFGVQITESYMQNVVVAALKKEPLFYVGLKNTKGDSFDAYIDISFNKEFHSWGMQLKFEDKFKKKDNKESSTVVSSSIEQNLRNFKKYSDFKIKLEKYFNIEGSSSLCCGNIFSPNMNKNSIKDLDKLGLQIKEFLQDKNSEFFIDDEKQNIIVLSFQPNSEKFKTILFEVIEIIKTSDLNTGRVSTAAVYKRFCKSVNDLESQLDDRLLDAISSGKENIIFDKGSF